MVGPAPKTQGRLQMTILTSNKLPMRGHNLRCVNGPRPLRVRARLECGRAGWDESADAGGLDEYHRVLRVRPGEALRLLEQA